MRRQTLWEKAIIGTVTGLVALVISNSARVLVEIDFCNILGQSGIRRLIAEEVLALDDFLHLVHVCSCPVME